jgi:transposase
MLDEVIITETPPLYCCYGRRGEQVCVPASGNHARRTIHAVINILTGELCLLITEEWDAVMHQYFLGMIRAHWRGWNIILFEDRGTPHTAIESMELVARLGIEVRFLPRACPELNAVDHLFRSVKGRAVSNWPTRTIDCSADAACNYLYRLSSKERLLKAGVLSGHFWLTC